MSVYERIAELLNSAEIAFDTLRHEPVYTSEEAARVRGAELASGAKALICKVDSRFVMFVMPADRKLASREVRTQFQARSVRFASREEVAELTGLQPGSIPPFGSLFNLPTYCDAALAAQPRINFNAGDHAISINMSYADYAIAERPEIGTFSVSS
ncbi:MAG: YbaK/EbsC family protein [Pirellulaceae bacterium]|nr:hypothetical protein [Planctomycetales bacterium]MCA9202984.1 hypothetical protein [Planctomycetales bacterium]MCA9223623.1 hypothetical protein [Planctomycetales bacterium]